MRMSLRKTMFIVGVTLLTILAGFIIIKGVKIGNFEILGITGIIQKDKDITIQYTSFHSFCIMLTCYRLYRFRLKFVSVRLWYADSSNYSYSRL